MNLGDPELELIDPTPNVHSLFIHFDKLFFWAKLASRSVVRWSKRMYSCAGVCSYDRGGLCDIALSEPLLKLRPRKDLIETLLHEMIHAYLFITSRDIDRDGHGPIFQSHMHRINKIAGLNISIYHSFHDEVRLYQTHWWRCNGRCQSSRPHFGIVRRTVNRPPGPSDYWFESHKRLCGGTFIKIKEPENRAKKPNKTKSNGDITKFINNPKTSKNNTPKSGSPKPILKDSNCIPTTKNNGANTLVITKKDPIFNPKPITKPEVLIKVNTSGKIINGSRKRSNSTDVNETVRNIWANKQLPTNPTAIVNRSSKGQGWNVTINNNVPNSKPNKQEATITSPPSKIKKINDYFKSTATTMLKDVYGEDFKITQSTNQKAVAVKNEHTQTKPLNGSSPNIDMKPKIESANLVDCPVCNAKVSSERINSHLDECLNKDVIETLSKHDEILISQATPASHAHKVVIPLIPTKEKHVHNVPKPNYVSANNSNNDINNLIVKEEVGSMDSNGKLTFMVPKKKGTIYNVSTNFSSDSNNELNNALIKEEKTVKKEVDDFDSNDKNKVKEIVKKITYEKLVEKSNKFIVPKKESTVNNVGFGNLPSFLDDRACKIENPTVSIEPSTSDDNVQFVGQMCACCGNQIDKPIEEHLEECLAFFTSSGSVPEEGASTSFANDTIVIDDDDDILDESLTLNATGTKSPCPCCLQMIEQAEMREHLDVCLLR